MSAGDNLALLPNSCLIAQPNGIHRTTGRWFHLPHLWQYYLRVYCMLNLKKSPLGARTQSRTAVAFVAATLLVGGSATEASAKSRHHHYRHHQHHARAEGGSWRDANASIVNTSVASSSGGHSFSGMASYYGSE